MQSTKQQIFEAIIKPLEAGYKPLHDKQRSPVQYGEMVDLLVTEIHTCRYSVEALEEGMSRFRRGWEFQRWPVLGELLPYLDEAAQLLKPVPRAVPALPEPDTTGYARDVMQSEQGQVAIRRGVALGLWEWAERNFGHIPTSDLIDKLVADKADRDERLAKMRAAEVRSPLDMTLIRADERWAKREAELAAEYGETPEPTPGSPLGNLAAG